MFNDDLGQNKIFEKSLGPSVNPLSAGGYPKMAVFSKKKRKISQTFGRSFDEVETSPRAPVRSIFI